MLNFAESGWAAHQSLNKLIKLYAEGSRPDIVVFYDGVNDIGQKCRCDNDIWSDDHQGEIREALAYKPEEFGYYAGPILRLVRSIAAWIGSKPAARAYDCDSDPTKAERVAA